MFLRISTVRLKIAKVEFVNLSSNPNLSMKWPTFNYSVLPVTYPVLISVAVTYLLTPLSTVTPPMVTLLLWTGIPPRVLPRHTTNHTSIKILIFYKKKKQVSVVAWRARKQTFSMTNDEPGTMSKSDIKKEHSGQVMYKVKFQLSK